jgi:hypothetical protein
MRMRYVGQVARIGERRVAYMVGRIILKWIFMEWIGAMGWIDLS